MKTCLLLAASAALLALGEPVHAQDTDPAALLDEAIAKVRDLSYRSEEVDWPALERRVRAEAEGARDDVDLLGPLETLLEGLGDGHSFLNVGPAMRADYVARHGAAFDADRPVKTPTSPFTQRRTPLATLERGKFVHLVVPSIMGGGDRASAYARTLHDGLAAHSSACAAIVDLRGNGGGNVWPMLLGLSPLLGEPWNSLDVDAEGRARPYVRIEKGRTTIVDPADENVGVTFLSLDDWRPLPALSAWPVAVLTDDATGSSGEGVAIAFRGRDATRSFGSTTYGVASANEGFMLGDRINVVVTTSMMVDRNGNVFPDGVPVDEDVANPATGSEDPGLLAATRWLDTQPRCRLPRPERG